MAGKLKSRSPRTKPKLKETEFYCVKCKKRCKSNVDDVCVEKLKNGAVALKGSCHKCDCLMYKFVVRSNYDKLLDKYGKC